MQSPVARRTPVRVLAAAIAALLIAPLTALIGASPAAVAGVYDLDAEATYKEYWVPHSEFTAGCPEYGHDDPDGGSFYIEPGPCTKTLRLTIPDDFSQASKVEVYLNLWRNQNRKIMRFNVNGGPTHAPTVGSDWSRTPWAGEIPKSELVQGVNTFTFWTVPTGARGHVHDLAVRIYHDAAHPLVAGTGSDVTPPTGSLTTVAGIAAGTGGNVNIDGNTVTVAANAAGGDVKFVEFHAKYDGYDEDVDGATYDWHSHQRNNWNPGGTEPKATGSTTHHVGTDTTAPYSVAWDVTQLPAQGNVLLKARIVDVNGNVREAAGGVSAPFTLVRTTHQVEVYRIPNFRDDILHHDAQYPDLVERAIDLPDLTNVTAAWIQGNYWQNPWIRINDGPQFKAFPTGDVWVLSNQPVPVSSLKPGTNRIVYGYNPNQVRFGQYVEKPGPLLVLRRSPGTGAPVVSSQPREQVVKAGQTATFTAAATGASPIAYQWQRNGVNIPGATGPSYTTPATALGDSGAAYRAVVTNGAGTATTSAATLVVNPTAPGAAVGPWWDSSWRYRVAVQVGANGYERADQPAEAVVNFSSLLSSLGAGGTFDPESVRVVEVDAAGTVVDGEVPSQFDPEPGYDAVTRALGRVTWLLEGPTSRTTTRRYHVYFEKVDAGIGAPSYTPLVTLTDNVVDAGQDGFKVVTPAGTYHYQKQGAAFSSILDDKNNDWINYSTTTGSGGSFRGIPNFPFPEGYFHPGFTKSTSAIVGQGPLRTSILSTSSDGIWQIRWDIYPRVATATVLKADKAHGYWFLYEGTPGGEVSSTDTITRSNGQQTPIGTAWTGDLVGDEWTYVTDPADARSMFLAQHEDDTLTDSYYLLNGNMTVLGFGRDQTRMQLTAAPARFSLGLMPSGDFATGARTVTGAYKDLAVAVGTAGARDGTAAVTLDSDDFSPAPLDGGRWEFVSPVGDGSVASDGSRAVITVPGGKSHDLWAAGNKSVRIVQQAPDGDFEVEAKFESTPTQNNQMQGILVEQDANDWLRFDIQRTNGSTYVFAGSVLGGSGAQRRKTAITPGTGPLWLRVKRVGDTWTSSWSKTGTTWLNAHSFSAPLTLQKIGPFAANHNATVTSTPAFTAKVDYFFNTAAPVVPEDGDVDTTPPAISAVAAAPSASGATVTWTTDEPSTSQVDAGITTSYGTTATDGARVTSHSLALTGLACETPYNFRVTSVDASGNSASSTNATFTTSACPAGAGFVSDDFSPGALDSSRWSVVRGAGDGSVMTDGSRALISVPGGVAHDLWTSGNRTNRIVQAVPNGDVEVEVKFESLPTADTQMQGIFFEQDAGNFVRFDFHRKSTGLRIFAASVAGTTGTARVNSGITAPGPDLWLRVRRAGDVWTMSWSRDGAAFTAMPSFTHRLVVTKAAVYAGNSNTTAANSPAFTSIVDYAFNTASPVADEDGDAVDTNPPVLSGVSAATSATSATVSWTTDEPATSRVDHGSTTSYGSNVADATPKTSHSLVLEGLTCATTYQYRATSVDAAGNAASSPNASFTTASCRTGGIRSDDFNPAPLDSSLWSVVDPVGGGSVTSDGTRAVISVPGGASHDLWTTGNKSVRLMQAAAASGDFQVEAKFESLPAEQYQMQGLLVQEDASNWMRFDLHHDGTTLRVFGATIAGSTGTMRGNTPVTIAAGSHVWLRVGRIGSSWTLSWSTDGTAFTVLRTFTHALTANEVGVFAGNHHGTPASTPAFDALVDYFFNTASPIADEDGGGTGPPPPPPVFRSDDFHASSIDTSRWQVVNPVGDGSVSADGFRARLNLPGGTNHDVWTGGNKSLRLVQPAADRDFEAEVKFETRPTARFQMQGILVQQDADDFIRADTYFDGSSTRVFAATFVNGTPTIRVNTVVNPTGGVWLRLARAGSSWTLSWSPDGSTWTALPSFTHALTVSSIGPFAANNGSPAPAFTAVVDYFFNRAAPISPEDDGEEPPAAGGPAVDVWYGDAQSFGQRGVPQQWANVLGTVSDPDGVASVSYTLNGGAAQPLWIGPNAFRLTGTGDFNVEIDYAALREGANTVQITAVDTAGVATTRAVTVNRTAGVTWPVSTSVDWSTAGGVINDVAQVVDGKWQIVGGAVRTVSPGYDRLIAVGDRTWTEYEAKAEVTIHSLRSTCSMGVGIVMGWQGHTTNQYGRDLPDQPRTGHPFPGLGWYSNESCTMQPRLNIFSNNNTSTDRERVLTQDTSGRTLTLGTTYLFKVRTQRTSTGSRFFLKVWPKGTTEPSGWNLQADGATSTGGILLGAHWADVSFGPVTVNPI